jgi:hypothetical protein
MLGHGLHLVSVDGNGGWAVVGVDIAADGVIVERRK